MDRRNMGVISNLCLAGVIVMGTLYLRKGKNLYLLAQVALLIGGIITR